MGEMNTLLSRVPIVVVVVLAQVALIVVAFQMLSDTLVWLYSVFAVLGIILALYIVTSDSNPSYKTFWLAVMFLLHPIGGLLYLVFYGTSIKKKNKTFAQQVLQKMRRNLDYDEVLMKRLKEESGVAHTQAFYLKNRASAPVYDDTKVKYLDSGEEYFKWMIREMRRAERFIFLEYFIIGRGQLWDEVLKVLQEKVAEGVEVRVMYDDFGCMRSLPFGYVRRLRKMGIRAVAFNPLMSVVAARFNHRTHRKITVIDGKVGFTGGANIADEYINAKDKCGHWKDAGVMVRGGAVHSLTVMFLALWDTVSGERSNDQKYFEEVAQEGDGYVAPFTSGPSKEYSVATMVYTNMITKATKEICITTPYLVPDDGFLATLRAAAECGVDVKIITPGRVFQKIVHQVTKSYYRQLLMSGVKIYEYTPGIVHGKTIVVDGEHAVVGTINLDYRSLHWHFECGVYMYRSSCIGDIEKDFREILAKSRAVTLAEHNKTHMVVRMNRAILRIFAPLM